MTPSEAKALAQDKRAARQRRAGRIRKGVAAATLSLFVAFFSTIYVQMASGNDPSLAPAPAKVVQAQSTTATSTATATAPTPAPVTTQQS